MDPQHLVSFALDILLVIGALVAYLTRPRIGGQLARGLRILLVGVMILGLAHLIETLLFAVVQVELVTNEIIHRVLIGIGFVFVILGFLIMRRAFYE